MMPQRERLWSAWLAGNRPALLPHVVTAQVFPDGETWNAQTKEAAAIFAMGLVHAPLFPVAPFFTATVWYSMIRYHTLHRRAHIDPAWAAEHLPWHVDHHLGPNQDANWCVTHPWFDDWMGTRVMREGRA